MPASLDLFVVAWPKWFADYLGRTSLDDHDDYKDMSLPYLCLMLAEAGSSLLLPY